MGKTGTTNEFRDALFVGSTYGIEGITVAVRIGFDDNRSLGSGETGARLALPVFREVMMGVYREQLAGRVPAFPDALEASITGYLQGPPATLPPALVPTPGSVVGVSVIPTGAWKHGATRGPARATTPDPPVDSSGTIDVDPIRSLVHVRPTG